MVVHILIYKTSLWWEGCSDHGRPLRNDEDNYALKIPRGQTNKEEWGSWEQKPEGSLYKCEK